MNRREFLHSALFFLGTCYLSPRLLSFPQAEAAVQKNITMPPVLETNLTFAFPLENRLQTNRIVLHHIGGTDEDVSAADVHQWHLNNGWAGIGYHFVIRKNGSIERGRPLNTIGAHCYGYNKDSVGINLVGDFEMAEPTDAQITSVKVLTAWLCRFYRLNPKSVSTLVGHRDLNDTLCPGRNLYTQINDIRKYNINTLYLR